MGGKYTNFVHFLVLASTGLLVGLAFSGYGFDDPYICYRYVSNILDGYGWSFNPGTAHNSSTSPLHTAILALFGLLYSDIPSLAHWVGTACLVLAGFFTFLFFSACGRFRAGVAASLLLVTNQLILLTYGIESMLYLLTISASLYYYTVHRLRMTTLFLALAFLVRHDGALLAVVILGHYYYARRTIPFRPILLYTVIVAPWLLYSFFTFGSPIPSTLGTKMLEGSRYGYGIPNFLRGTGYWFWSYPPSKLWSAAMLPFFLLGIFRSAGEGGRMYLPAIWASLYLVCYTFLNVPDYHWYFIPLVFTFIIYAAHGAASAGDLFRSAAAKPAIRRALPAACALLLLGAQILSTASFYNLLHHRQNRLLTVLVPRWYWDPLLHEHEAYSAVGRWLKVNTPPEATVATEEVGILGYYSRRRMTDVSGIATPEVLNWILDGQPQKWFLEYRNDYIVCQAQSAEYLLGMAEAAGVQYTLEKRFGFDSYPNILVFRRRGHGGFPAAPGSVPSVFLTSPPARIFVSRPPRFSWKARESETYSLDIFSYQEQLLLRTDEDEGLSIREGHFVLPESLWDRLPREKVLFWRVRMTGMGDGEETTVSEMRPFLIKQPSPL